MAGNTVITTFVVNTNPTLLYENNVPARTIGVVDVPGQDVRVVRPLQDMPGIYITKIDSAELERRRRVVVRAGAADADLAARRRRRTHRPDVPQHRHRRRPAGRCLSNDGIVGRTSRIDACGEIVEGYAVSLSQTYSGDLTSDRSRRLVNDLDRYGTRNQTRNVDYVFATAVRSVADSRDPVGGQHRVRPGRLHR